LLNDYWTQPEDMVDVSADRLELTQSALVSKETDPRSEGWLADNVWHPFLNGTGATQIYNNFATKKIEPAYVAPARTLSTDWAVQSLASAGGAILTYSLVGKAAGLGLNKLGSELGVQGAAARFLSSETTAQILGAAAFDFAKAPNPGETRLGNAAGSIAAFSLFSAGNSLLARSRTIAESSLYTGLGRVAVGAAGGLASMETSHLVSNALGQKSELSWDERFRAMANGGFVNFALPPLQKSLTTIIDNSINANGKGIPVERYLEYSKDALENRIDTLERNKTPGSAEKLASLKEQLEALGDPSMQRIGRDNPFARVKVVDGDNSTRADMAKNRVEFNPEDGPGKLAHELKHLRIAKLAEPFYQEIAKMAKSDPLQAEANYYVLRANMESAARQAENLVSAKQSAAGATIEDPVAIGQQMANNGKTYFENWASEWRQIQVNPKFRPSFEYAPAKDATTPLQAKDSAAPPQAVSEQKSTETSPRAQVQDKTIPAKPAAAAAEAPVQMGATVTDKGVNFAVRSEHATAIDVLIYDKASDKTPSKIIPMKRNGNVWQAFGEGLPEGTLYQLRASGANTPDSTGDRFNSQIGLIDPEAKAVSSSEIPLSNRGGKAPENFGDMPKAIAIKDSYDWKGDKPPNTPMSESVFYELNVRGYTGGDATLGKLRGTYRGLIEKIPHLKELGITAVELMPIMQGDRAPWAGKNPVTGEQLYDSWNYNTVSYKAPDGSLAADGHLGQQVNEFKDMVKAMHDNHIEVILDVVYNHTREMDQHGPTVNLRGLDNSNYYMSKPGSPGQYADKTGVGNTLSANNPMTQDLILDSLRYWVQEMHVDGFRFDLAPTFKYEPDGSQKAMTELMQRIESDSSLSKVKLIAEPWSIEQYYLGHFSDKLWSEWNGDFRDTVRKFVKSDTNQTATLAERIAGSPGWFDARAGRYSINGVTFHDGFTLEDLVSYNQKHNFENGENNNDGSNDNFSWNSGVEGPLDKANIPESQKMAIEALRGRQVRNLMALMMLSRGVPHVVAGDEMLRTTNGNNNTWNQDKLNKIDWSLMDKNPDFYRFTKMMIDLRQTHGLGNLEPSNFVWHGVDPFKPDFADYARLIAWQTKPGEPGVKPIYSAFNAYWEPITVKLPPGKWFRLVDTNLPAGQDIVSPNNATFIDKTYTIQPRSGIVLEERK
jgi:isoamylase